MKDKKIFFTSIGVILLALIISIFAMVPIDKSHDAYSKNWLKNVDDNAKITEVSLPGTHDSGATHSIADVAGKCQDLSIKTQLEIGVRFFDLRLQLVNDEFKIVHSFVDQNLKFSAVLEDLYSFIKENNSEYLIISIKEEASPVNSTLWFDEALIRDFEEYKKDNNFLYNRISFKVNAVAYDFLTDGILSVSCETKNKVWKWAKENAKFFQKSEPDNLIKKIIQAKFPPKTDTDFLINLSKTKLLEVFFSSVEKIDFNKNYAI